MKFVKKYPGILVSLVLLIVYGFSAATTLTGFGDSDELIAAGYKLALPHPPGYPLLTLIIYGVTHIPVSNPGHLAHLLGSVLMALTVGLMTEILNRITLIKKWWYVVIVGMMVGTSKLVWEHGVHLEVFGLLSLLSMGILGVSIKLIDSKYWWWLIWGILAGIGLGHHQLMLLSLFPLLGYLLIVKKLNRSNWKNWFSLVMMALVGLAISVGGIFVIGKMGSIDSWKFDPTIIGVFKFLTRADYSGYSVENGEMTAYFSQVDLSSVFASLGHYVAQMWSFWGAFGLFGFLGIGIGKKVVGNIYWPILVGFVLSGPILAGYISLPSYPSNSVEYIIGLATLERMYVLSQLWWGLLAGVGLLWLLSQKWASWWLDIVLALLVLMNIINVFPERTLAHYDLAEEYTARLFDKLPSNSNLICLSDLSCFGGFYYQSVLGNRTDVGLISSASQFRWGTHSAWKFGGFNYEDNPFRLGEAIGRATLNNQPIYIAQLNAVWTEQLGLNGQAFYLVPNGNLSFGVSRERVEVGALSNSGKELSNKFLDETQPDYKYVEVLKAVIAEQNTLDEYIVTHPIETSVNEKDILAGANKCWNNGDLLCEIKLSEWLVWRNPNNSGYRKMLAMAFIRAGLDFLADREYQYAESISRTVFQLPDQNPE